MKSDNKHVMRTLLESLEEVKSPILNKPYGSVNQEHPKAQVKGTEKASAAKKTKNGVKHPFYHRMVGEGSEGCCPCLKNAGHELRKIALSANFPGTRKDRSDYGNIADMLDKGTTEGLEHLIPNLDTFARDYVLDTLWHFGGDEGRKLFNSMGFKRNQNESIEESFKKEFSTYLREYWEGSDSETKKESSGKSGNSGSGKSGYSGKSGSAGSGYSGKRGSGYSGDSGKYKHIKPSEDETEVQNSDTLKKGECIRLQYVMPDGKTESSELCADYDGQKVKELTDMYAKDHPECKDFHMFKTGKFGKPSKETKERVDEGEINWDRPEDIAKSLFKKFKGQPISKDIIKKLWKNEPSANWATRFMIGPEYNAILRAYDQLKNKPVNYGPKDAVKPEVSFESLNEDFASDVAKIAGFLVNRGNKKEGGYTGAAEISTAIKNIAALNVPSFKTMTPDTKKKFIKAVFDQAVSNGLAFTPAGKTPAALAKKRDSAAERKAAADEKLYRASQLIQTAVGNAFPDGDPIDYLVRPIKKLYGLGEWDSVGDIIDKAVRKYLGAKDLYAYYEQLRQDFEDDQRADQQHFESVDQELASIKNYGSKKKISEYGSVGTSTGVDQNYYVRSSDGGSPKNNNGSTTTNGMAKGTPASTNTNNPQNAAQNTVPNNAINNIPGLKPNQGQALQQNIAVPQQGGNQPPGQQQTPKAQTSNDQDVMQNIQKDPKLAAQWAQLVNQAKTSTSTTGNK